MEKQLIISIGREFGSGGHEIAEMLAERFGLTLYDSSLLEEIAKENKTGSFDFEQYDEEPTNQLFSRILGKPVSTMEENIANMQFDFLRMRASKGESFVVVGRCAETVLRPYPAMISIFVLGDREHKIERVKNLYHISDAEAEIFITKQDKKRKTYHNFHSDGKWGDSRNYDICVNSSKLGEKETAEMLIDYIIKRQELM